MGLSSGTRLGPYEIVAPLGAGGMGEVYRARDTRLGREVALKVLPGELSSSREGLERFEQEARSASALNHPNIVTIYELGQVDSTHYIAMELVEGKVLRDLLSSGQIPLREFIEIAAQVADGLAKAHEAGIVHRDLKPENLMVSKDGLVKILDFGLAKLTPTPTEELSEILTMPGSQTRPGVVFGTLEYMSPEQAIGTSLDFRSDQFSLGLVLYEMATGERAFGRNTKAEVLAAVLRDKPKPVASVNPDVPIPLCWVIERCLAKEREKRYSSTRDLARDLAALRDHLSEPASESGEARPSNLPVQRTPFVGREKETAAAKELLLRKAVRLLTITGPGGIGKTRLALQVASGMLDAFPRGIYFVSLAAVNDAGLVASVIAQTLGLRESGGQPSFDILKEYLQNSLRAPMLLLLDNFEHLLTAAPMLAQLLAVGPNLKVLVTSRAALHVYGEYEFPVPSLTVPDSQALPPVEALSQYSAVALFIQRAVAVRPDFELTKENAAAVAEICARLDGLPLAIELAAARVKLLSLSAMRARLASRLQLLTGGARDLPARQQTLRAAIDWSYDLLNPAEQNLFKRLSVFVGGCTLEAAEAVCNIKNDLGLDLLDGMASMVDESLIQQLEPAEGESRFVMLETIREYALEKLEEGGDYIRSKRAHAAYYLVLAEEEASADSGSGNTEWLDRFEIEHDNFRAALEWLTESGDPEWGLRLGAALFRFWETREYLAEGRERLVKLLKRETAAARTKSRARTLFAAGVLAGGQGDYAAADTLIGESLQIARELEDKRSIAISLNALAVHARDQGNLDRSRLLFEETLGLWREVADPLAIARSVSNLANVVRLQGDYTRARSLYEECLSIFGDLGDRTGIAWSLNYEGDVARDQGDTAAARSLYERSLAAFREVGDRWGIAGSLADLGNLARDLGDFAAAHPLYCESIKIFQELTHKRGIARLLEGFACLAAAESQPERALRLAGAAAALRQSLGAPLTPAEHAKLGRILETARQAIASTAGATAWLEGWATPPDKAIEEALATGSASPLGSHTPA
jgi:predicted ATPase/serine/threonine protein kinase